jgi:hypothetical protein
MRGGAGARTFAGDADAGAGAGADAGAGAGAGAGADAGADADADADADAGAGAGADARDGATAVALCAPVRPATKKIPPTATAHATAIAVNRPARDRRAGARGGIIIVAGVAGRVSSGSTSRLASPARPRSSLVASGTSLDARLPSSRRSFSSSRTRAARSARGTAATRSTHSPTSASLAASPASSSASAISRAVAKRFDGSRASPRDKSASYAVPSSGATWLGANEGEIVTKLLKTTRRCPTRDRPTRLPAAPAPCTQAYP